MKEPEIRRSWTRIERWINHHIPDLLNRLHPGATDAEITEAEKSMGIVFPVEARISFRIHDGCEPYKGINGILNQRNLFSVSHIATRWLSLKRQIDTGMFSDIKGDPYGPIRDDWWNPLWIPISDDSEGNANCLDLDPARGGLIGQIISVPSYESERQIVAPSFGKWLKEFASDLEVGEYVAEKEEHGIIRPKDLPKGYKY